MQDFNVKMGGRVLRLSNLDKVLYPRGQFNKAAVLDYYRQAAPVLLPHLRQRPVTLLRYPEGIFKEAFYEKDAPSFTPSWVKTFPVPRAEGGVIHYILINNAATLIWAANLAALELHPFLHRVPRIDTPTHVVFDLDPGEGAKLLECCEVGLLLRELLSKLELQCFPKVSGSKGIQVYLPLNTRTTYEQTQAFARAVAEMLARQRPRRIVSDMSKQLRVGKVFIDWSQNIQSKTTVAAYSLRAKSPRPLVSMPVTWKEMESALQASDPERLTFSPEAALERIETKGDLFAPVLDVKQKLPSAFIHAPARARSAHPRKLTTYAARRDFSRTAEPEPVALSRSAQGSRRRFVVQKHDASHLHYDFRLELHDVLKSWAVPKGVPLRDHEQRSAFATEDHPLEYLQFEGTIPQGQYGGGTVMVWDIGQYEPVRGNYYQGELTVFLTGRKLKGEWTLKRIRTDGDPSAKETWLIIKTSGDAARIGRKRVDVSALTGRSLEQIAEQKSAVGNGNKTVAGSSTDPKPARLPSEFVEPMKATAVKQLPEGPEWEYEIKWDGYRALAEKNGDTVRLLSLKNKSLSDAFPGVVTAVGALKADSALLDGEIVAIDAQGKPSFQALQNRASFGGQWQIVYYAFDLLKEQGEDLRRIPLRTRKARLHSLVTGTPVRFNAALPGTAQEVVKVVQESGLEGVVAKRKDSPYAAGRRTRNWLKLKLSPSQEFIIGGYHPSGATFSSLLVGYYEANRLLFAGKVRQGLNPRLRATLTRTLKPIRVKRCPFVNLPSSKTGHFGEGVTGEDMAKLQWVRPEFVAQISFTEWTSYGLLRHATFLGLREDKHATEVIREVA